MTVLLVFGGQATVAQMHKSVLVLGRRLIVAQNWVVLVLLHSLAPTHLGTIGVGSRRQALYVLL